MSLKFFPNTYQYLTSINGVYSGKLFTYDENNKCSGRTFNSSAMELTRTKIWGNPLWKENMSNLL